MAKVLVVEDDQDLSTTISDWLKRENYLVQVVEEGRDGLHHMRLGGYDAVILDWNLPLLSGIEVLKEYRHTGGTTPVLMLTAKGTVDDKALGLDSGADDYLPKPFHMKELSARLRALLRRTPSLVADVLTVKDLTLNPRSKKATRGSRELSLYALDLALLEFLMRHEGQVFSADTILNRVWPPDSESTAGSVRQSIRRLRQQIDQEGEIPLVHTVHGIGYKIDSDSSL